MVTLLIKPLMNEPQLGRYNTTLLFCL